MNSPGYSDVWVGTGIIALAMLGYFVVIPVGIDSPNSVPFLALAPAFWPNIIMALLALLGLVLLIQGVLTIRSDVAPNAIMAEQEADDLRSSNANHAARPLMAITAIALLFVYYAALQFLGFVAASMLILPVYMLLAGVRNYLLIGLLSIGLPIGLYFFFTTVARVALPLGVFESLLS